MTAPEHPASDAKVSRATARRLSEYLRFLRPIAREGGTISSQDLGVIVGVSAAQVRRDLAALGHLGQRGIGYEALALISAIRQKLGIDREWSAVLIGVGNLARALIRHRGFAEQGFHIVGLFDNDPAKIGTFFEKLLIEPVQSLPERLPEMHAELGILTVPAPAAPDVVDLLTRAKIKGILNFAPSMLKPKSNIPVVTIDLAMEIEQLAFKVQHDADD